jgi:hypothetical protein
MITDEPTDIKTFEEYGFRFDIEENFLDDKSKFVSQSAPKAQLPDTDRIWLL